MTHGDAPAYGLWLLVILNSLVFIIFAFSFSKPRSPRDWRSFGAFSAFISRAIHRDVPRLSANDLSVVRVAPGTLSGHGSDVA